MIAKPLKEIEQADLKTLITEGVPESRSLEYKETLPGRTDAQKKEFLADVCALANSGGGDLIFGISEERNDSGQPTGVPSSVVGLEGAENEEDLRLRIEQSIRGGMEPRVSAESTAVAGFSKGPVLVLRVHHSWAGPHMVTFKGTSRFYARSASGKYQMDVHQIREAFLMSGRIDQEIRAFRDHRLLMMRSGPVPVPRGRSTLVVHSVPLQSFAPGNHRLFDLFQLKKASSSLKDAFRSNISYSPNLDGFVINSPETSSYIQMFRNGALEFADAGIAHINTEGGKYIDAADLGDEVIEVVGGFLRAHSALSIVTPCFIFISLLNVREITLYDENYQHAFDRGQQRGLFQREVGALPDVRLDDLNSDVRALVRPILDIVSQAAGYSGSPLFRS